MLSVLFSKELLFRDAGFWVHTFNNFLIENDCSLHIIKHLPTLDNKFSIESVLEKRK